MISAAVADIHAAKVKQDYNEQHTQTVASADALAEPSAEVRRRVLHCSTEMDS